MVLGEQRVNTKYKVLDLFSGIGMISYGLHKTDRFETVAFCEWDEKCRQVLNKNFPGIYCYSDISNLEYRDGYLYSEVDEVVGFTDIDLIVGGFPCQDISQANARGKGLGGARSGLWSEYKRLIGEIKPKGVLIENVSNLRSRGLGKVLQDLNSLGYDAEWHCITARHFGATHERDRIFILAYRNNQGMEGSQPLQCIEVSGQRRRGGQEALQSVIRDPFRRSDLHPQPLLCGVDARSPGRVDRLKQVGNTVYWPIIEHLGYHMARNLDL
jgi:DNA (cytosine-5)-methyltransferase 1